MQTICMSPAVRTLDKARFVFGLGKGPGASVSMQRSAGAAVGIQNSGRDARTFLPYEYAIAHGLQN